MRCATSHIEASRRFAHAHAVADAVELDADGVGHFASDCADGFRDRQAGADAAAHRVDGFGKAGEEFTQRLSPMTPVTIWGRPRPIMRDSGAVTILL